MKTVKLLAMLFCVGFFILKPAANTQVPQSTNVSKENENRELKAQIDSKLDSVILKLKKVVDKAKKSRVVYVTRWRSAKPDTVFLPPNPDDCNCDTTYYVVKKNNLIKRIFTGKKADTLSIQ